MALSQPPVAKTNAASPMSYSELSTVKHRVAVGLPLPFNVRNADRTLLLARGQVIENRAQLESLMDRGALVDVQELLTPSQRIAIAPRETLPALWQESMAQITETLRSNPDEHFQAALGAAAVPAMVLIERDPDLAIFQVLRQDANAMARYGMEHALHAGITSVLVAKRLGWSDTDTQRAFKAALTMNISMLELQSQLATQADPMTAAQREAVHAHPWFSTRMLELAGVNDPDWLDAVATHHDALEGANYPPSQRSANELAALIRRADIYVAKLSPRQGRRALAADQAGRAMFRQDPKHEMTAALIKEFGVYPPGCFVKLVSGETGVVLRRGGTVMAPVVAVLSSAQGQRLAEPVRRDTANLAYAVHAALPAQPDFAQVAQTTLAALAA